MSSNQSPAEVMGLVFAAVNRHDLDGVMRYWAEDSFYDNPMFAQPARGKGEVAGVIGSFIERLRTAGEEIVVDRISNHGSSPVFVEWHIAREIPLEGIHIADFDAEGNLANVRIFLRGN